MSYRKRIYAKYASQFSSSNGVFDPSAARRWGGAYDKYFRHWLPEVKDAVCIDLACGNGSLLFFLKERGYTNISGIDISEEQVALARIIVPEVVLGDILEFLQDKEQCFDLISGLDIIEHLTKDEVLVFLDSCFRALKPGGRLILQTPNGESPLFGSVGHGDFTHETVFTPANLARLLKFCGFEEIEARAMGPVARGIKSTIRVVFWKCYCLSAEFWNMVETGTPGSKIASRVFLISGVRKQVKAQFEPA